MKQTLLLLFISLCLVSCGGDSSSQENGELKSWLRPNGKLKVLSTTAMIHDLVQQIGRDKVDSLTLIRGELDPHSYQLVKGDDEKLAYAQLIFASGLGLEHGPSLAHYLHDTSKVVLLGDRIAENDPSLILIMEGQVDPHIWMDIALWARTIPLIVEALSRADPTNASLYQHNGDTVQAEMEQVHTKVRQTLQDIPDDKRYLVTSHDAFNYFTRAYLAAPNEQEFTAWSRRFAAPEGLAPDSQLSATDIQKILDHLLQHQVHVLFPESNVSKDSIRKIVQAGKENGLDLIIADVPLYGDAMGRPGSDGDTYLKMIQHNASTLHRFLGNSR